MSPLTLLVTRWSLQPVPLVLGLGAVLAYVLATRRLRGRWPLRRTAAFLAGVLAIELALCSGEGTFDDRLLSAHMVQHLLLLLAAPLALLAGRPVVLVLRALPAPRRRTAARALGRLRAVTGPLVCLGLYTAFVLITHLPAFYDAAVRHPPLHELEHTLLITAGLLLWWPLLDADPAPVRRLGGLARLGYVITAMVPMSLIGAWLDRGSGLVYPVYAAPARALGVSALADQATAGALMWVAGSVLMVAVGLWVATAALLAEERRQQALDRRALTVEPEGLAL